MCIGLSCVAVSALWSLKLLKPRHLVSLWLKEMGESELGTMVMSSKFMYFSVFMYVYYVCMYVKIK